ncbi:SIS domain-containing protein [Thomasclavelia cocleata]|uniref:Galactosamine 6-phosphate isomerase AgaS n=1 Tax=Thomasclavelia cocleata TaxID=69824 RepID=A0A1I0C0M9_9FIRM|nr:SIS domain-containing protein [Thomasclavelia cocleata]MCR1959531.1 SIS domain-containing protein [Thomasclavelia cocleata]NDO42155.1 SIS domain-containing protein [Thomasclavelia cocleata]PJN81192.1 SIS domain-containing protein [Thomasclavelia cocleata]SET12920.1 galactosamine 6-phosphate isomerase AgaS [Thomasclavelia cocleata]
MTKTIFDINETQMSETKSTYTLTEIYQQPATWKKTCQQVASMKDELKVFINQVITQDDFDVILTGAGTSEFVGNTLFSYLNKKLNYKAKSYGTTDLVATPENYLSRTKPTLLISFGRSGNSPESVGAIDVAEEVCDNLYHLFVTCNKNGALSKKAADSDNCFAINLTDETHDQSFAMTSSFSNMYLATFLAFNLDNLDEAIAEVEKVAAAGQNFLDNQYAMAKNIVEGYNFKRIVYLGSNALKGISQESALKMLELTAGEVVTMYDTPLGFRHGPKSIIDDDTLTVVYISDNEYSRQYEIDLIKEMSGQRKGNKIVAVMNGECDEIKDLVDYVITFDIDDKFDNILLGFDYIIAAQVIAVLKSLSMGKTPDNPCPTGEVNRVVKGVTLYPYSKGE